MTETTSFTAGLAACVLLVALCLAGQARGQTITKCQDEDGNWHYGDFAAEACAEQSTITEIDERGLKVKETEAPPTQEELDARAAEQRRAQEEAEERARREAEEQRLLLTYDSADRIIDARDERVKALEREMESYELFRQDLVEEKKSIQNNEGDAGRIESLDQQIRQYDEAIQSLQVERREIIEKYNRDLEWYRELTGTGSAQNGAQADTGD